MSTSIIIFLFVFWWRTWVMIQPYFNEAWAPRSEKPELVYWIKDMQVMICFPGGSAGKETTCNAGDLGSIPGLGRSPGEGKGYPLQYSGLENSMNCIVRGVTKSWTQLSNFHFHFSCFIIMLKKRTNANEMMIIYFFKFRKAFEVISPLHFWELP